jgi:hypothetical protein
MALHSLSPSPLKNIFLEGCSLEKQHALNMSGVLQSLDDVRTGFDSPWECGQWSSRDFIDPGGLKSAIKEKLAVPGEFTQPEKTASANTSNSSGTVIAGLRSGMTPNVDVKCPV